MTTSLAPTDESIAKWTRVAERLLGVEGVTLENIDGGRNSRVYHLTGPSGEYCFKTYFRHASDARDRMDTEYSALRFLWDNGESCVPEPVAASAADDCAIYEWIDGERIEEPTAAEITAATKFIARLHRLKNRPGADRLRPASEACFSGAELVACLRRRLEPLAAREDPAELVSFIKDELVPTLETVCVRSRMMLAAVYDQELPREHRTLSPSDFGFHNALRRRDGGVVFLDLEYFGWDDPVKLICDFMMHPGMKVPADLKCAFASTVLREFPETVDRFEALFPLYGLKWCMILLNEFLPEHLARRRFAGMPDIEIAQRQIIQLEKARNMLRLVAESSPFPYGNKDRTH
ncbi:MAG TPA: aminoglycoside phosphotransferase family protein [Candidatus Solibacter sp.]|nr:aminoglycoside phosphotransferase family protein [Candidatus Solibacter sp.]